MTNEQTYQQFSQNLDRLLRDLEPGALRDGIRQSFAAIGERARQIALSSLRSKNFDVRGDKSDWESGLRVHVYSGGGGFLVTARGRRGATGSGAGEKGMHKNRFYGRTHRKLPILQWQEFGTNPRKTRGTRRRRSHNTGSVRPSHFLTNSEPSMTQLVVSETLREVEKTLDRVSRNNG